MLVHDDLRMYYSIILNQNLAKKYLNCYDLFVLYSYYTLIYGTLFKVLFIFNQTKAASTI